MNKIFILVKCVMSLWGEELFAWLREEAKKSTNPLDDMIVSALYKWLMKDVEPVKDIEEIEE